MQKQILSILGILLILISISGVSATNGYTATPAKLDGSGELTITNTGDKALKYNLLVTQMILNQGSLELQDDPNNKNIQFSENNFIIQPGERKTINVNVGDTGNKCYGVRIIGLPLTESKLNMGISLVVKIEGGEIANANDVLNIRASYLPIALSGLNFNVVFHVINEGNIRAIFEDVSLYPDDSTTIEKSYNTNLMDYGFKDYGNSVKIFIIPSPLVILLLIVVVIYYFRRNFTIQKV